MRKSAVGKHPSAAQSILFRLGNLNCQPEQTIIHQGEPADAMYFVISGKCDVWILNENRDLSKVRFLKTGDHFGEVALLYPVLRTATVLTANYTDLAVLAADDFHYICEKYPSTRHYFRGSALRYSDEWKQFLTAVLRRCPFFRRVSLPALRELIYYLPITALEPNTYLYKSGENAEQITFILSGKVVVYVPITDFRLTATQFYKSKVKLQRLPTQAVQMFLSAFGRKNDRFIVKFEMDYLERGSVICHNLTLLNQPSFMFVKTVNTCTVATLSVSQLAAISANIPEIGQAINNYRAMLRTNVAIHTTMKHHLGATDYDKSFVLNSEWEQDRRLWHAKMILRKCVIGKLLERRENRRIGFGELPNLSQKLSAYLEAEKREDQLLSEKIRKSVLHVDSQRLINTLGLLELSEVENPILAQFALEASNYTAHILTFAERMTEQEQALMDLKKGISKAATGISEVMKLVQIAVQLGGYIERGEIRGQAGMDVPV
jgi:CRP-like cAMP-binding protein